MQLCPERDHLFSGCSWVVIKVKEVWRITGIPYRPLLVMVHVWQKFLMLPTPYRIKSTLISRLSRVSHDLIQTCFLIHSSYYNKVHTILDLLDYSLFPQHNSSCGLLSGILIPSAPPSQLSKSDSSPKALRKCHILPDTFPKHKSQFKASFYVGTQNVPHLYLYFSIITYYVGVNSKYNIGGKNLQQSMLFLKISQEAVAQHGPKAPQ